MAFPPAWILAHSIPEHVDAETCIAMQSYFSKGTRSSPDKEAKASTFSFTLCSQVLHIALCLVCVCTQRFMQYLCRAISALSELLCTVQCRHCFQNKIQLNKICLNGLGFFATYNLLDFRLIAPFQVTSSTLRSIRCSLQDSLLTFLCSSFTVHQFQEGKETQELPEQSTPHMTWRGECSSKWTRLTVWLQDQQRGRERASDEEELRFFPTEEGMRCLGSSGTGEAGQHGRRCAIESQQEIQFM